MACELPEFRKVGESSLSMLWKFRQWTKPGAGVAGRSGRRSARGTADGLRIQVGTASRGQEAVRSREGLVEGVKVESMTRGMGCDAQAVGRRVGSGRG